LALIAAFYKFIKKQKMGWNKPDRMGVNILPGGSHH
jgi:hypothetical protein